MLKKSARDERKGKISSLLVEVRIVTSKIGYMHDYKNVENNRFKVCMLCRRLTPLIATVDRKLTNIPRACLCCTSHVIILSIIFLIILVHSCTIPITIRFPCSPRKFLLRCALVTCPSPLSRPIIFFQTDKILVSYCQP